MTLHRCFAWNRDSHADEPDGALWFPRPFQGDGRHDNPDHYGALYLAGSELSCVVEQLAPFRGQSLAAGILRRRGLPLAIAEIELRDDAELVDLDEPLVLDAERLRPSLVATRQRRITQPQALALYQSHSHVAGLRWLSTFESLWPNVTLFDRAARALRLHRLRELTPDDSAVAAAAEFLGLRVSAPS